MSYRLRPIAAVLFVSMLAFGVAAAQPVHARVHRTALTFDLIAGITTDPFYITIERSAQREARALGVHLISLGAPDAFTPSAQIPYVDLAIAQHPDAILIAPTDKRALIPALRRAARAGIPIFTVDTALAAPLAVAHIGSRNRQGGIMAARELVRLIDSRGPVVGISVRPGITTTDQRERGFAQELRRYPKVQYRGTFYDDDILTRAQSITARQLAQQPAPAGIFAMNALSGAGAIGAVTAAHDSHRVKLVEFDAEPLQVYTLRRGVVDALIAQDPWSMGRLAVRLARQWVAGRRAGIKKYYATQEIVITRANVDSPRVSRFLYGVQQGGGR